MAPNDKEVIMTARRLVVGLVFLAGTILLVGGVALAATTYGNGIYDASVNDDDDSGLGVYTARTGDNHPVTISTGDHQNVLYGGTDEYPSTSWLTVRSYTSETDYYNEDGSPGSAFDTVQLDDYATVEATSATATRTTYWLNGNDDPDALKIIQDVEVSGTTYENSFVDITTTVRNEGEEPVDIGIRYLWDWQIAEDDGPSFAQVLPDGPTEVTEQTYSSPTFQYYRIQDNNEVDSPLFAVYGTTAGRAPGSTPPDELMFVAWSNADDVTFDYTTDPTFDIASDGGEDDSAVLYFWGPDEQSAITLDPGDAVIVSESLTAALAGEGPPGRETATPIRHRTRTPTPEPTHTPAPPTATSLPPVPIVPPPTATPSGGSGPVIMAPATGGGPSGGAASPIVPGILAAMLAIGVLGGVVRLRARHR